MAGNNHGHTPAAWTGVIIAFIGFTVAGMFTVAAQPFGVAAGLAVVAIGGLIGLAMRAAGMGMPKTESGAQRPAQAAPAAAPAAQTQS